MGFTRLGWELPDLGADGSRRYEPAIDDGARAAARAQWAAALQRSRLRTG